MIRIGILICVTMGIALIALMFRASSNNAVFEANYTSLFGLGLALTIGLLVLIVVQVFSLVKKLRGRVFGSKLGLRLMAVFALMAIIPGGLVYTISAQFLNRSIDSWFDVPVDQSLDSALKLAKTALDSSASEASRRTREAALRAAEATADAPEVAKQLRGQFEFDEVVILNERGAVLGFAGRPDQRIRMLTDKPTQTEIDDALSKSTQRVIETLGERAIFFRVVVRVPSGPSIRGTWLIQTMQAAPRALVGDLQSVEVGVRDYQKLVFLRDGLKRVFALTLTLAMVLTLFSAISLSFLISERLSAPLSALAESTRAIAKGDFTKLNPVKSRDEFGVLTQSFNTMTRQLGEASDVVARKQRELETANAYLESILGNLTSGVVTLDERFYAKSINRIAADMLGVSPAMLKGSAFPAWANVYPHLSALVDEINTALTITNDNNRDRAWSSWEKQITIDVAPDTRQVSAALSSADSAPNTMTGNNSTMQMKAAKPPSKRTLLIRGTRLAQSIDGGFVIVIDDVTNLIQAQRDAAWGEVARRLAHEIKNPLTPIQLSAERMQMKLADKLPEAEREMLTRSTHTIVAQVGALKGMVDDFSLYSRASRMKPGPVDLNELVTDVLTLYQSMQSKIVLDLASPLPIITADPALLRQVIHNLMQNAQDALQNIAEPTIVVTTAPDMELDMVTLSIRDNGSGVRPDVKARIFEPYVTTKAKGTGLGLAIVKKIMDEHRGAIAVEPASPNGTEVTLALPILHQPAQTASRSSSGNTSTA